MFEHSGLENSIYPSFSISNDKDEDFVDEIAEVKLICRSRASERGFFAEIVKEEESIREPESAIRHVVRSVLGKRFKSVSRV